MSKDRQTFVDPKSAEEIESTGLARWIGGLLGVVFGVVLGVAFSMAGGVLGMFPGVWIGGDWGMRLGGLLGIGLGICLGVWLFRRVDRGIHNSIARYQHFRRHQVLRSQEHQDVPDTAISRAQRPGEPQPTDAALSITNDPEEIERLTVEIEEHTEDQVPVRQ